MTTRRPPPPRPMQDDSGHSVPYNNSSGAPAPPPARRTSNAVITGLVQRSHTRPVTIAAENSEPWIHGKITREQAAELLRRNGNQYGVLRDGVFLVRESANFPGAYSLSVTYDEKFHHYLVETHRNGGFKISGSRIFKSLNDLVEYHKKQCDGLCTRLRHATIRVEEQAETKFKAAGWDIAREDIDLSTKLGAGQFGDVVQGSWRGSPCAIKTMKKELLEDKMLVADFLVEASVMTNIKHPNLVQLLGVCTHPVDEPILIVTELMNKGCLQLHLRRARRQITQSMLLMWSVQLSSGFAYLEGKNFIHRDIACRNVLINDENVVKIGDFGLARCVVNDVYEARSGQVIAIKWTAPESIKTETYTTASDVWSFGILLWEIFSFGLIPYPGMEKKDVVDQIEAGYRMPSPEHCSPNIYSVMGDCWEQDPSKRPRFSTIETQLRSLQ